VPQCQRRHRRDRHGLADASGDLWRIAYRPSRDHISATRRSATRHIAAIAAGFTGLLSLFNIGGRFFWATLSDYIGRKNTYYTFFLLGIALYATAPWAAHIGSKALFVAFFCIILSMYGGGFATVPAYLADIFGTQFVGAIHGRLLTAWSTAGIIGPVVVNYIREAQIAAGVPRDSVYDFTMYILAGMLVLGFVCNWLVVPVAQSWFVKPEEFVKLQAQGGTTAAKVLVWDRQRGIGCKGRLVLGLCRRSTMLGRLDHPRERVADFWLRDLFCWAKAKNWRDDLAQ
jgi:MFS family permease